MQKYEENLAARINGNNLQPLAEASITVTDNATGLPAALYQADELTLIPQPLVTDESGFFGFKAANGEYTLTISGSRFATFTRQITLIDPDQIAGSADNLHFIQSGTGAVARNVADELRERVSVMQFGADDSGVASTVNVQAFEDAAAKGVDVHVPKPAVAYYLASDPVIPGNVNVLASPSWFSGPGKMPVHRFIEQSEGVEPRIFDIKDMAYGETANGLTKRPWLRTAWLWLKGEPAPGFEGTVSDGVADDSRCIVDAHNARGWGRLDLVEMTANMLKNGVFGTGQGIGHETDVNNETGVDAIAFDSGVIARGKTIVSGGTNRPSEALMIEATRTPDKGNGDNRWFAGIRVYRDAVKGFIIHVDDANTAPFARIPPGCPIRWTHQEAVNFVEYQDVTSHRRILWSQTAGHGYDFLNFLGNRTLSMHDGSVELSVPLRSAVAVIATPATLDAGLGNSFVLTTAGTITGGIASATNGQRISISNFSGGTVTLNRNTNMRTSGGAAVTLAPLQTVEFMYYAPTYVQIGPADNA